MTARKLSVYLILALAVFFIISLVVYDKNVSDLAKVIDLSLAIGLWSFAYSYLPLEKKRAPYIKISIVTSVIAIIIQILVIAGFQFYLGVAA